MRSIKPLAVAAALVASVPITASAQSSRPFRDSWFWGLQTGAISYYTANATPGFPASSSVAPTVGLDWMITRSKGGLYVAYNQAFLSAQGTILNGPTSADSGLRIVDVKNLRRFELAAMAFPGDFRNWHPYVGFGFSFKYLGGAEAQGPYTQQRQIDYAVSAVNDVKAGMGPAFIGGTQFRFRGISAFGQLTASSVGEDFLLANGKTMTFSAEFGIRYNMGSSIER